MEIPPPISGLARKLFPPNSEPAAVKELERLAGKGYKLAQPLQNNPASASQLLIKTIDFISFKQIISKQRDFFSLYCMEQGIDKKTATFIGSRKNPAQTTLNLVQFLVNPSLKTERALQIDLNNPQETEFLALILERFEAELRVVTLKEKEEGNETTLAVQVIKSFSKALGLPQPGDSIKSKTFGSAFADSPYSLAPLLVVDPDSLPRRAKKLLPYFIEKTELKIASLTSPTQPPSTATSWVVKLPFLQPETSATQSSSSSLSSNNPSAKLAKLQEKLAFLQKTLLELPSYYPGIYSDPPF